MDDLDLDVTLDIEPEPVLKEVRELVGVNQEHFGLFMGMPRTSISKIERKEREQTYQQTATLYLIAYLLKSDNLGRYVFDRFDLNLADLQRRNKTKNK